MYEEIFNLTKEQIKDLKKQVKKRGFKTFDVFDSLRIEDKSEILVTVKVFPMADQVEFIYLTLQA